MRRPAPGPALLGYSAADDFGSAGGRTGVWSLDYVRLRLFSSPRIYGDCQKGGSGHALLLSRAAAPRKATKCHRQGVCSFLRASSGYRRERRASATDSPALVSFGGRWSEFLRSERARGTFRPAWLLQSPRCDAPAEIGNPVVACFASQPVPRCPLTLLGQLGSRYFP